MSAGDRVTGYRHNLPAETTSYIGREREQAELRARFTSTRLLTLVGSGGVGKTRLALHVARDLVGRWADGVWVVELAALSHPSLLPATVAATVGLGELTTEPVCDTDGASGVRSPTTRLAERLRRHELMLVLDNCDRLVTACAELAAELLRACPGLMILATSRESLGIAGETAWPVPPLSLPTTADVTTSEAVRLFAERAQAARPTFALNARNAPHIARICTQLDGIPLAIELAAARLKVQTVEEIAARLGDRFDLLTEGNRAALPRHRTLRALVDWSYDLLSEPERVLLRRLSVFAGGWTLDAACAVAAVVDGATKPEIHTLTLLTRLVDKSLVLADEHGAQTRYRFLETIRQYAAKKLASSGEESAVRSRLCEWALALVQRAEPAVRGLDQEVWLARLESEHDNLRLALAWCIEVAEGCGQNQIGCPNEQQRIDAAERGLRLASALGFFWATRGHLSEGRTWLSQLLALEVATRQTSERAGALGEAATLAWLQGDIVAAGALVEAGLAVRQAIGDRRGVTESLNSLGHLSLLRGEYATARAALEEAEGMARADGHQYRLGYVLSNLGLLAYHLGDFRGASARLLEAVGIFRRVGNEAAAAMALTYLSTAIRNDGDRDAAWRFASEGLEIRRRLGSRRGIGWALTALAQIAIDRGQADDARRYLDESMSIGREIGDRHGLVNALEALARLAAEQGHAARALRVAAAATAFRAMIGLPASPTERQGLDRALTPARQELGARAEVVEAEGRAMLPEQAGAEALASDGPASSEGPATVAVPDRSPQAAAASDEAAPATWSDLTRREREVAQLIAAGLNTRQLAETLVISHATARVHVKHILRKLGFTSRIQIAVWATQAGGAEPVDPPSH